MNKVLVIKTEKVEDTKAFFEQMGLSFVQEQHGNGPIHFSSEVNGNVLEVYPLGKDGLSKVFFYEGQ